MHRVRSEKLRVYKHTHALPASEFFSADFTSLASPKTTLQGHLHFGAVCMCMCEFHWPTLLLCHCYFLKCITALTLTSISLMIEDERGVMFPNSSSTVH